MIFSPKFVAPSPLVQPNVSSTVQMFHDSEATIPSSFHLVGTTVDNKYNHLEGQNKFEIIHDSKATVPSSFSL